MNKTANEAGKAGLRVGSAQRKKSPVLASPARERGGDALKVPSRTNEDRNRDRYGVEFREAMVDVVWRKATIIPNENRANRRRDACGATIDRDQFGRETETGWEIDHIMPRTEGGGDELANLQPLHWQNNRHKGQSHPSWTCLRRT
jgi:hypothetical protein